jgi:hypothetical protein
VCVCVCVCVCVLVLQVEDYYQDNLDANQDAESEV